MGLFSRNFDRPGPGVNKDEPRKKGAARFFELFFRDLGDLVKLNLLFCICIIPTGAFFVLGIMGLHPGVMFILSLLFAFPVGGALVSYYYYISKMMRDDPSYVWFEFKRKFIENFKQAAPIGMLCTAFIYAQILLWATIFISDVEPDLVIFVISAVSLLLFGMIVPYIFLHYSYIDLKTMRIIRNSFLMSFAYMPRSFMGAILGGVIWILVALYFPLSLLALPILVVIGFSLSLLLCLTWVWKPFNTYFKIEETLVEREQEKEDE